MILVTLSCAPKSPPEEVHVKAGQIYVTWDALETDRLASIWLIKRFIDPEARFEFVPEGTLITNGIPFDTPDAEFRRYHAISCFQSIVRQHPTDDPAVIRIGEITHDIEINFWGEKRFDESVVLNERIRAIVAANSNDTAACVSASIRVFDELSEKLATELQAAQSRD